MESIGSKSQSLGSFLHPLLISVAGIACTALAILAYHFLVLRRCLRRRRNQITQDILVNSQQGLINSLPVLSYSIPPVDELVLADQTECFICLGEFEDGDIVRLLPNCRHGFHISCIDQWLRGNCSCPVCRSPVVSPLVDGNDKRKGIFHSPRFLSTSSDGSSSASSSSSSSSSSEAIQSPREKLLRHCFSTASPMEGETSLCLAIGLKRSLSVGERETVLVNIHGQSDSSGDKL